MEPSQVESPKRRVVLFTRYPIPGQTKTRLIPLLGAKDAAALHRALAEHALQRLAQLAVASDGAQDQPVEIEVRYTGADQASMRAWLGGERRLQSQGDGDLGMRMHGTFVDAAAEGVDVTVIVGSDVPALETEHVAAAFAALEEYDTVVGPARDGGYYLIGLRRPQPQLFADMPWGSHEVLAETIRRSSKLGLALHQLEPLADIDRPEDLLLLSAYPRLARFAH